MKQLQNEKKEKKGSISSTMAVRKGEQWFMIPLKVKYFH